MSAIKGIDCSGKKPSVKKIPMPLRRLGGEFFHSLSPGSSRLFPIAKFLGLAPVFAAPHNRNAWNRLFERLTTKVEQSGAVTWIVFHVAESNASVRSGHIDFFLTACSLET